LKNLLVELSIFFFLFTTRARLQVYTLDNGSPRDFLKFEEYKFI